MHISGLFEKIKKTIYKNNSEKVVIQSAILNCTGAEIEKSAISFSPDMIRIKTSPLLRNEIFLKKGKILGEVQKTYPHLTDISY